MINADREMLLFTKHLICVETEPASKVFRAAVVLLQRTIKDTVFGVFNLTAHVFIYLMDDFARKHRYFNFITTYTDFISNINQRS